MSTAHQEDLYFCFKPQNKEGVMQILGRGLERAGAMGPSRLHEAGGRGWAVPWPPWG